MCHLEQITMIWMLNPDKTTRGEHHKMQFKAYMRNSDAHRFCNCNQFA
jgi:hypothetical protein